MTFLLVGILSKFVGDRFDELFDCVYYTVMLVLILILKLGIRYLLGY